MPITKCTHITLEPLSSGYEGIEAHEPFEICLDEHGFLVLAFEGHDGGGIVIDPTDVTKLRKFLIQNWIL